MTEKINPADAIRLLDAHEAVAVDVREPDEYAVGHIPGAKLLPLGQVLTRAEAGEPGLYQSAGSGRHPELAL